MSPVGIGERQPELSFELLDSRRSACATGWRVLAATSLELLAREDPDLWDSGRIELPIPAVAYGGRPLASREEVHWMVRAWDAHDAPLPWSRAAAFTMGLLDAPDRTARFIAGDGACPCFRRDVDVPSRVARALLFVTALGCAEARINGRPVSPDVLVPGWTDTRRRIPCRAYDVRHLLVPGAVNTLAAVLADGWYAGHQAIHGRRPGRAPALALQLDVLEPSGRWRTIATDGTWDTLDGPTVAADLLMGEEHDARLQVPGWDLPGFGGARRPATVVPDPAAPVVAHPAPPVRPVQRIVPLAHWPDGRGRTIHDVGQNVAGRARLRVAGDAGTRVALRFAEVLEPDGSLHTESLRRARATDAYVLRGDGEETWEPSFTQHGFRYVEAAASAPLRSLEVEGVVLQTDLPATGSFSCDVPLLERIWRSVVWTARGNAIEVPTDCPQRDERLGWTGDALLFAPTAVLVHDARPLLCKWLADLLDAQLPNGSIPDVAPPHESVGDGHSGWGDAVVAVPHVLHAHYGDTRTARRCLPAIGRWLEHCWATSRRGLRRKTYGDWLAPGPETSKALVATACFARAARQASELAAAVDRPRDADAWARMHLEIARAFRRAYQRADGTLSDATQTACALALTEDLLERRHRAVVEAQLVADVEARGLATGFVGTAALLPALAAAGRMDLAHRLLASRSFPSWGYALDRGATTIWERWDAIGPDGRFSDPRMTSFNHPPFGSAGAFLVTHVAGISPAAPGFTRIRIRPEPTAIVRRAAAGLHTVHGLAAASWEVGEEDLRLQVVVPPGATAEVVLPGAATEDVLVDGHAVRRRPGVLGVEARRDGAAVRLAAGSFLVASRRVPSLAQSDATRP